MAQHPRKVSTLAAALDGWEDFWFCVSLLNRRAFAMQGRYVCTPEGAMVHYSSLRNFLLSLHGLAEQPAIIPATHFLAPREMAAAQDSVLFGLPVTLGSFTMHSRREYGISTDLQAILGATSLENVTWDDVDLPHPSFAVSLAQPFKDSTGAEYDFLLVTTSANDATGRTAFSLQAWQCSTRNYVGLSPAEKRVLIERADRRDWKKLNTTVRQRMDMITTEVNAFGIQLSHGSLPGSELVLTTARRDFESKHVGEERGYTWQDTDRLIRLLVGFCLYLDTLPPGSPHVSDPNRVPLRTGVRDRKAITNAMELCDVHSSFKLTPEDRIGLGLEAPAAGERAPYELCWHFRRAHKRRPPGQGNNPDAERSVKVKGAIIRADRAEDPGAPGGAFAEI